MKKKQDMENKVIQGDCLEELKNLEDNSVDAIVTDPPYGLSFMGKKWDYDVPSVEIWKECLRVLKPGGYLLSFAGTRTQHRMAVRIEDAGFEIRDMIAWVYGSGFPKSLNIGKAIEGKIVLGSSNVRDIKKLDGVKTEVNDGMNKSGEEQGYRDKTYVKTKTDVNFTTDEAKEWEGWGTALKPALEPITVARKPLSEKTVAENVLKWGTGGINIDGSRVGNETFGRFPANLIHDGSDEVVELFPNTKSKGHFPKSVDKSNPDLKYGKYNSYEQEETWLNDSGSASRFFYCAKASKSERNKGCEELEEKAKVFNGQSNEPSEDMKGVEQKFTTLPSKNNHPTVKPIALMEYLVKLVTKENAVVLDPFAGSGSTLLACKNLNRNYIGIEREADYIEIINKRLQ